LILEDLDQDVLLMERELQKGGFTFQTLRVDKKPAFIEALKSFRPDIILSDYNLPGFNGMAALEIARNELPTVPFLFVSGFIGEELAIEALKNGAIDYVVKDRLSRLGSSVRRALREARERSERKKALQDLQDSEHKYRSLFEEVQKSRTQLENLSRQLLQTQETERRRIARELHDEIGQSLTALKINLEALQQSDPQSDRFSQLIDSIGIVERVLWQIRNLSLDLRPSLLDDLGLVAALRWYLDRQSQRGGFQVDFVVQNLQKRLHPDLETAMFRVAQEAITNILKHARAKHVHVEVREEEDCLVFQIMDDGTGFDVASAYARATKGHSIGLLSMKERVSLCGGEFGVKSSAGVTEISATFPLSACFTESDDENR
jgi:two-component system, NarL family, sensor histidine kinase UhpB